MMTRWGMHSYLKRGTSWCLPATVPYILGLEDTPSCRLATLEGMRASSTSWRCGH